MLAQTQCYVCCIPIPLVLGLAMMVWPNLRRQVLRAVAQDGSRLERREV